jgi:CVNH domain
LLMRNSVIKLLSLQRLDELNLGRPIWNSRESQSKSSIQLEGKSMMNLKLNRKVIALSLVLLAAPFIRPDAARAGGFIRTCTNTIVLTSYVEVYLHATCAVANGPRGDDQRRSRLKISDYIANYDGNLSWALGGGGFHRSCSPKDTNYQAPWLYVTCKNGRGGFSRASINLNEKISNQNGFLAIDR